MYWVGQCPSSQIYVLLGTSECDLIWLSGGGVTGDVISQVVWINTGISPGVVWVSALV